MVATPFLMFNNLPCGYLPQVKNKKIKLFAPKVVAIAYIQDFLNVVM